MDLPSLKHCLRQNVWLVGIPRQGSRLTDRQPQASAAASMGNGTTLARCPEIV